MTTSTNNNNAATRTDAAVIAEIMAAYDKARAAWEAAEGDNFSEAKFHAWFTAQACGPRN